MVATLELDVSEKVESLPLPQVETFHQEDPSEIRETQLEMYHKKANSELHTAITEQLGEETSGEIRLGEDTLSVTTSENGDLNLEFKGGAFDGATVTLQADGVLQDNGFADNLIQSLARQQAEPTLVVMTEAQIDQEIIEEKKAPITADQKFTPEESEYLSELLTNEESLTALQNHFGDQMRTYEDGDVSITLESGSVIYYDAEKEETRLHGGWNAPLSPEELESTQAEIISSFEQALNPQAETEQIETPETQGIVPDEQLTQAEKAHIIEQLNDPEVQESLKAQYGDSYREYEGGVIAINLESGAVALYKPQEQELTIHGGFGIGLDGSEMAQSQEELKKALEEASKDSKPEEELLW